MPEKPLVLVSNIRRLGQAATPEAPVEVRPLDGPATLAGARRLLVEHRDAHAILVDDRSDLLLALGLARWLRPRWLFGGPRLMSLDLVLARPRGLRERTKAFCKRLLLASVDLFLHYFQDLRGYRRYFGISARRSVYVPFKVNGWERIAAREPDPDGEYVFTSGRSLRDFDTFMAAMSQAGAPGLLTYHRRELALENGTPFPPRQQPANVRIEEDDGTLESWIDRIAGARLVVVPVLPESLRAVGISLALVAMGLGKAVIITEGPTTRGVFQDEVITVPVGDAAALAKAITGAWHDRALREQKGRAARRFAGQCGGEIDLHRRVLDAVRRCVTGAGRESAASMPAAPVSAAR